MIGADIAATETVNGLLRVADHDQMTARRMIRCAVNRIQNAVLNAVGVLEFIHQRHRPGGMKGFSKRLPGIALQSRMHIGQQCIEAALTT